MSSEDLKQKIQDFEALIKQWNDLEAKMLKEIDEYNDSRQTFIYKENWKEIEGYPNYLISSYGRVWNKKHNRFVKNVFSDRYYYVGLSKNGKMKRFLTHRLVAQAFLLNPENKATVDHQDTNRRNNNIENLRWCSPTENMRNKNKYKNNTTDFNGVSLCKCTKSL